MSQFGDFATQAIDKAKQKAGLNDGRSRLTDDNEQAARPPHPGSRIDIFIHI